MPRSGPLRRVATVAIVTSCLPVRRMGGAAGTPLGCADHSRRRPRRRSRGHNPPAQNWRGRDCVVRAYPWNRSGSPRNSSRSYHRGPASPLGQDRDCTRRGIREVEPDHLATVRDGAVVVLFGVIRCRDPRRRRDGRDRGWPRPQRCWGREIGAALFNRAVKEHSVTSKNRASRSGARPAGDYF